MSGIDVFISYAREDRQVALVFADSLQEEGFTVWWDASLRSGETFDEIIEQNLRTARAVVVLWSPHSVSSRWVRAEATVADRRNKLVPAIISACELPLVFELTHTGDLSSWRGDRSDLNWRMFIGDVSRLVKTGIAIENAAASGSAELSKPPADALPAGTAESAPASQPPQSETPPASATCNSGSDVHCLQIEDGELKGEVIIVDCADVKIGRSAPADVVLPHKSISREHCLVGLVDGQLIVTDLDSTNGTYVDEAPVSRAPVPVGSVVRVGHVCLRHAIMTRKQAAPRERTWFQAQRIIAA